MQSQSTLHKPAMGLGGKRSGYVGALRIKLAELRKQDSSMELESSLLSVRRSSLNIESPMDMASESSE